MKFIAHGTVVLALLIGTTVPLHAMAQEEYPSEAAKCQPGYAQWSWQPGLSDSDPDFQAPPIGTATRILACEVGGHHVRINSSILPVATYRCGATTYGKVSVWVDGVKVVDRKTFGDYLACQFVEDPRSLVKVIVNHKLRMTVCIADPYKEDVEPVCDLVPLDLAGKPRNPVHDGALVRTPPSLDLTSGDAACNAFLPQLDIESISGLPAAALPGVPGNFVSSDESRNPDDIYTIDLDNDGRGDRLDLVFTDNARNLPGVFTWTPAATGKAITINEALLGEPGDHGEGLSDSIAFVMLGGDNYLYRYGTFFVSGFVVNELSWVEAMGGGYDSAETTQTRRLYRLSPDGSATKVCGWTPHRRPEEFL